MMAAPDARDQGGRRPVVPRWCHHPRPAGPSGGGAGAVAIL